VEWNGGFASWIPADDIESLFLIEEFEQKLKEENKKFRSELKNKNSKMNSKQIPEKPKESKTIEKETKNSEKMKESEKIIDLKESEKRVIDLKEPKSNSQIVVVDSQENNLDSFFDEIFEIKPKETKAKPKFLKEPTFKEMKTICIDGDDVLISSDPIKTLMSDYQKIDAIQEWFSFILQYTKKKLLNCDIILIYKESKLTNPINSKIRIENVNIVKYYEILKKKEKVLLISSNNLISKKVEHPQITLMNPRKGLNMIVSTLLDNRITEVTEMDKWLSNDFKKFLQKKKKKEVIVTSPVRDSKLEKNSDNIPVSKIPKKSKIPVIVDDDNDEVVEDEIISLYNAEYSIPKDFSTLQITDSKGISNYEDMMIIVAVFGKILQMNSHKEGVYEVKYENRKDAINALKELQEYPYEVKPVNKSGFLIKDRKRTRPKENEELNKPKIQKTEASIFDTKINPILLVPPRPESPKIQVIDEDDIFISSTVLSNSLEKDWFPKSPEIEFSPIKEHQNSPPIVISKPLEDLIETKIAPVVKSEPNK
jgi:hypothetical protein